MAESSGKPPPISESARRRELYGVGGSLSSLPGVLSGSQGRRGTSPVGGDAMATGGGLRRSGSLRKLQAADFADKIHQLELEGSQLRNQVEGILQEVANTAACTNNSGLDDKPEDTSRSTNYADLTDISREQKALENMRSQLEMHSRDAQTMHRRIHSASPKPPVPFPYNSGMSPSISFNPTHPCSLDRPSMPPYRRTEVFLPPTVVERELKEAKENVEYLQHQLKLAHEAHLQESTSTSSTVEDLKARLYEAHSNLDTITRLRESETRDQEAVITRLKDSLDQLMSANRKQEQTLLETNHRLDQAQQNHYILDGAIESLRNLLTTVEQRRGTPFHEKEPSSGQSATMLVHTLDRCLREYENELDIRGYKLRQFEQDAEEMKRTNLRDRDDLEHEFTRRIANERDRAEREIKLSHERAETVGRQMDVLHSQLQTSQATLDKERRERDEIERKMGQKLNDLDALYNKDKENWTTRISSLETVLDTCQREAAQYKAERDAATKERTMLEAKYDVVQSQLNDLEATRESELASSEENARSVKDRDDQIKKLEGELKASNQTLSQLEMALASVQEEGADRLKTSTEYLNRKKPDLFTKIQILLNQNTLSTNRVEAAENESKARTADIKACHEELARVTGQLNMAAIELDGLKEERAHINGIVGNRCAEIERLTAERDYYFQVLDEKTEELANVKVERQRLAIQLDDKMNGCRTPSLAGMYSEKQDKIAGLLDEARVGKELLVKKLKAREKRLKEVEASKIRIANELKESKMEIESLYVTRENLTRELKECRKEIHDLCHEKQSNKHKRDTHTALERKVIELTEKLNLARQDLKQAQDSFTAKESVEKRNRLSRSNSGINLKSGDTNRVLGLEEEVASLERECDRLRQENTRLCHLMQKMCGQNEKLSEEFEFYLNRNQELRDRLLKADDEHDRLMKRISVFQEHVESLEDELAKSRMSKSYFNGSSDMCYSTMKETVQKQPVLSSYHPQPSNQAPRRAGSPLRVAASHCRGSSEELKGLGAEMSGVIKEMRQIVDTTVAADTNGHNKGPERYYHHSTTGENTEGNRQDCPLTATRSCSPSNQRQGLVQAPREQRIGSARHYYSQAAAQANKTSSVVGMTSTVGPMKKEMGEGQWRMMSNNSAVDDSSTVIDETATKGKILSRQENVDSPSKTSSPGEEERLPDASKTSSRAIPASRPPEVTSLDLDTVSGRSSPVEELLMTPSKPSKGLSKDAQRIVSTYEAISSTGGSSSKNPPISHSPPTRHSEVPHDYDSLRSPTREETEEMCRVLDMKIDSLSRLGSDAEKGSKDKQGKHSDRGK